MADTGTNRTALLRSELASILEREGYDEILGMYSRDSGVLRALISMTYDKALLVSWRAIDAVGRIGAGMKPDRGRALLQRILWMLREESGNNAWTGPELMGEIIARNPGPYEDIAPIVVSFHDELIMRAGTLRAMARIAGVRPEIMREFSLVPAEHLRDPDPAVRGHAVYAIRELGLKEQVAEIEPLLKDDACFLYYDGRQLISTRVGDFTASAMESIKAKH